MSKEYDLVMYEGQTIPKELVEMPYTARQRGATFIERETSEIFQASDQNNHLEANDEFFEVELSEFGSEEKHLVKVIRTDVKEK